MIKIKYLIAAALFLPAVSQAIAPPRSTTVPKNSIYKSCGHSLYDQSALLTSPAYLAASLDAQQDMLEAHFYTQRRKCNAWELTKVGATLAVLAPLTYKLFQKFGGNQGAALGLGGAFMAYGFFYSIFGEVVGDITNFVKDQVNSAKSMSMSLINPTNSDPIEKYEIRYVRQKPFIDKRLQEILEENFINARAGVDESSSSYFGMKSEKARSPVDFAKAVLALPMNKTKVVYDPARIEQLLGSYDPEILAEFKNIAVRHAAASTGVTVKKIVTYFKGPPGVGKTLAAERITQTMEVPFQVIKLGGVSVNQLVGTKDEPGLLLEAILNAKYEGKNAKNLVIFFDELDRALGMTAEQQLPYPMGHGGFGSAISPPNKQKRRLDLNGFMGNGGRGGSSDSELLSVLLTLIEPSTKTFPFPYLGIDYDISSIGFMGAGNFDITDEALASRFEIIDFDGYKADFKEQVVRSHLFDEQLAPHKTSELILTKEDFNDTDWRRIRSVVKFDRDPGFRSVIKFLESYFADKVLCKHYGECQFRSSFKFLRNFLDEGMECKNFDECLSELAQPEKAKPAQIDDKLFEGFNLRNNSVESPFLRQHPEKAN